MSPSYDGITVISTLALKGALEAAAPGLNAEFHATQALLPLIAGGQVADVLILTAEGIDQVEATGKLVPGSKRVLGTSSVGLAVKAGAPKPAIGTVAQLTASLLAAASVGHSAQGASGLYFAGLLDKLAVADKLKKRVVVEKGPVAVGIANGEIELGAQMLCELSPVPGIDIVGALPTEVGATYAFSAAIMAGAKNPEGARDFLDTFMRTDAVKAAMRSFYFDPAE